MPIGRPSKKVEQLQFRTVAVPEEVYKKIKELAASEERTIARQLGILIKTAHKLYYDRHT